MSAAAFNDAITVLNRDLGRHHAALQVLERAAQSQQWWRYVAANHCHVEHSAAIKRGQRALAEELHWHKWSD